MSSVLELTGITRVYEVGDSKVHALKSINLSIDEGEMVAVMGTSGSGKSTLLNILGCLDRPTAGEYLLDGIRTATMPDLELSSIRQTKIGFIFQFFHLIPRLTAAANVELPMVFAGIDPAERAERIRVALDRVGLTARSTHRPNELSGGERQRVAIARAIVMRPKFLLADEPTGNLDSKTGSEIISLIEEMNREGLTVVIVTHDPKVGARAKRRIQMSDGEVIADER